MRNQDAASERRQALERATTAAASSIRSTPPEQFAFEAKLAEVAAPLPPEQRDTVLRAVRNVASAGARARRNGIPGVVLEFDGLRALVLHAHSQLRSPGVDPFVYARIIRAASQRMEAIRPEYKLHVAYHRRLQRVREDVRQALDSANRARADLAVRRRGEFALLQVNEGRRAKRYAEEDRQRSSVEQRLAAGKSLEQIAQALGWSKTKVHDAAKRWGLTNRRLRRKRSGQ